MRVSRKSNQRNISTDLTDRPRHQTIFVPRGLKRIKQLKILKTEKKPFFFQPAKASSMLLLPYGYTSLLESSLYHRDLLVLIFSK